MKSEGVIDEYAIAGAMALLFWAEPIPTYDLDVLVFLPPTSYQADKEHIIIEGIPVQFVPAPNELADEAIETAEVMKYGGVDARVVRPEYLIALYLDGSAKTPKRRERAAALRESDKVDTSRLQDLMKRFKLTF